MTYLGSIAIAVFNFPFVAILFTAPYATRQYRKYGACQIFRTLVVYSFILYCMCAYFLVILPLPSREAVAQMTGPYAQLIPFSFVADFIRESGFAITKPATYFAALKTTYFYQPAFNAILLLPFGLYLRYYFKRNLKQTILITFLFSLFFEVSQITGLFWIYPRPYRLFDVDDLMLNTLGGVLGYWITPIFRHLPTREELDARSYQSGEKVSIVRRAFAFGFDWVIIEIVSVAVTIACNFIPFLKPLWKEFGLVPWYYITICIYFLILPIVMKGTTLGKRIVRIKLVDESGSQPKWWQYLIRYGMLYGLLGSVPIIMLFTFTHGGTGNAAGFFMLTAGFFICFAFMIRLFVSLIRLVAKKDDPYHYEKWSRTHNVSTVEVPENINEMEPKNVTIVAESKDCDEKESDVKELSEKK